MADISLSKAVRSNLLSLQSTAQTMAKTQERLATGNKVNSALDNPTNFFTASALNSRAGDMGNLMDSMSNGIKTIEAADNGLKSITKTVESMQSTLRQARQDKSFKTQSFTIDASATGLLEFTGGAVGSTATGVSLGSSGAVPAAIGATADYAAPTGTSGYAAFTYTSDGGTNHTAGSHPLFDITVDGGASEQLEILETDISSVGNNDTVVDSIAEFTAAINFTLARTGRDSALTASDDGTTIRLTSTNTGVGSRVAIDVAYVRAQFLGGAPTPGVAGTDGTSQITISNGTNTATINLTTSNAPDVSTARSYIQSQLTAQGVTGVTVGGTGNRIDLTGAADGSNNITVGGPDAASVFGASPGVTTGAPAGTYSVDQQVLAINSHVTLAGKIRASNDAGRLRIENLSTESLTVHGVGSDGELDGTSGTATIGGNEVRKNLVKQFNELRDQLDKLADDASFNGINLLRGDKLKLTFNETGTSTIDIQAKKPDGTATAINNTTLDIATALNADFDSDTSLDARLDKLADALGSLRSHASSFGSNLSIVQNRQDFTKSMINTLETGAANLTLADTNEEAANLLALQTRQQLSSTALSMASQADQAVLRLF